MPYLPPRISSTTTISGVTVLPATITATIRTGVLKRSNYERVVAAAVAAALLSLPV